jgi:hypothetical protein
MTRSERDLHLHLCGLHSARAKIGVQHRGGAGGARRARDRVRVRPRRRGRTGWRCGYEIGYSDGFEDVWDVIH